ncbi:hypothetical protein WN943_023109 [Citrus x changshan-huyou]
MQIVVQILVMVRLWKKPRRAPKHPLVLTLKLSSNSKTLQIGLVRIARGPAVQAYDEATGKLSLSLRFYIFLKDVACSAINMNFATGAAYNYSDFVTSDDIPLDEDYFEVVDSEVSNGSVDWGMLDTSSWKIGGLDRE